MWQAGCREDAERDSAALTAANAALTEHLGVRLAHADDAVRSKLVSGAVDSDYMMA